MHPGISNTASGQVRHQQIGPEREGQRLDNYLQVLLKGVPRGHVYRLLRTGQVRVNGKRAKPHTRLVTGDWLRIPPVRTGCDKSTAPSAERAARLNARVIHEDKHFLVIDKPSGMASHGGSGIDHGVIELMRAARPQEHLELAHRLDRDTSGVLVLTRARAPLRGLQQLIRDGAVTKQYLALLAGSPRKGKFDVNAPLEKHARGGGERMVRVSDRGKPALTFFKQLETYRDAAFTQVTLATGRTHQIRVHAAHAGFPLAGDDKYAPREVNRAFRAQGLKRLFLHAARFEFEWHGNSYSFNAPLPDELRAVLDRLK